MVDPLDDCIYFGSPAGGVQNSSKQEIFKNELKRAYLTQE